ncbi:MAG: hypothetical protein ACRDN0_16260 [Trebonia sp.]
MAALAVRGRAPVSSAALIPLSRARLQTPARLRVSVAAIVVLAAALAAVIAMASAAITSDFQAIGQRDAPEVSAATGLYFSLNDMDAQVANVLLVGNDAALAADRAQDVTTYSRRSATPRTRTRAGTWSTPAAPRSTSRRS